MSIDVQLKSYEGPLDLLLDLIKEHKMDIYDIPIAEITEQYLGKIREMEELNLHVAGEFLVMAATLLYIKSKVMLPEDELEEEEEEELDPREELVQQLLEYQSLKEAARELDLLQNHRSMVYRRSSDDVLVVNRETKKVEDGLSTNLFDLIQSFSDILKTRTLEEFHEVYEEVIPIEVKMDQIKGILNKKNSIFFDDLFPEKTTRNELIATFLAILELIKGKLIKIFQTDHCGRIKIERKGEDGHEKAES